MNSAFIVGVSPEYDEQNIHFQKSKSDYLLLRNKFGTEGVKSFMENICNIGITGSVNAVQMLKYIHRYSDKEERNRAFRLYKRNNNKRKHTIKVLNDDGIEVEIECSKYVAHAEKCSKKPTV